MASIVTDYIFVNVERHIYEGGNEITDCEKKSRTKAVVNSDNRFTTQLMMLFPFLYLTVDLKIRHVFAAIK